MLQKLNSIVFGCVCVCVCVCARARVSSKIVCACLEPHFCMKKNFLKTGLFFDGSTAGAFALGLTSADRKSLRVGKGVGKQGHGNRFPIDDRNPIRKFSIDCLDGSKSKH